MVSFNLDWDHLSMPRDRMTIPLGIIILSKGTATRIESLPKSQDFLIQFHNDRFFHVTNHVSLTCTVVITHKSSIIY